MNKTQYTAYSRKQLYAYVLALHAPVQRVCQTHLRVDVNGGHNGGCAQPDFLPKAVVCVIMSVCAYVSHQLPRRYCETSQQLVV